MKRSIGPVYLFLLLPILMVQLSCDPGPPRQRYKIGDKLDSLNGVYVFYNGPIGNVSGRNMADGYNLGLKYQCVEFVKRYYFEHYGHKMPNSYGHARHFFQQGLADGQLNRDRGLIQCTNPSNSPPRVGDLLVFGAQPFNKFGHVAIVARVGEGEVEIIQQNVGPRGKSRETYPLKKVGEKWKIERRGIVGWLRKA